jgi:hypothetical protein
MIPTSATTTVPSALAARSDADDGSNSTARTLLERGLSWRRSAPELTCHTWIVPSRLPAATSSPLDENATASIDISGPSFRQHVATRRAERTPAT